MPLKGRTGRGSSISPAVPLLALLVGALTAADARAADDKEACVRAVERAQLDRLDGKLRVARDGFVTCARPVCPGAIRQDCTRWVAEVDASLPSVVFEAVWSDGGGDVTGLSVLLDGQPLPGAEAGRAVTLDPGEHTFRFEAPGAPVVETRNVIREGEKNRILRVTFARPAGPQPLGPPAPAATATSEPAPPGLWQDPQPVDRPHGGSGRRPIPTGAFVLGGVALAGLGGFAYFGLMGNNELDTLRSTCVHACNPSDVSSARNQILVGDILAYVGLAAAGVATWLVLTRPTVP